MSCYITEEFFDQDFESRHRHFRNVEPDPEDILSFEAFDEAVLSGGLSATQVDLLDKDGIRTVGKSISDFVLDAAKLNDAFFSGNSIRIRGVDYFFTSIRPRSRAIARIMQCKALVNAYISPPGKKGLIPHFDGHDVFVIQCQGEKLWNIYSGYKGEVSLPYGDPRFYESEHGCGEVIDECLLRPGDVLYVPRGVQHSATAQERGSVHVTVGLHYVTPIDLLLEAVLSHGAAQLEMRRALNRQLVSPEGRQTVATALRAALVGMAGQLDIDDIADGFLADIEASHRAATPSRLNEAVRARPEITATELKVSQRSCR